MSLYLGENLISGIATPIGGARNIGQIIQSTLPLSDAGLHLLDGALINGDGIYHEFVTYIADLYAQDLNCFTQDKYVNLSNIIPTDITSTNTYDFIISGTNTSIYNALNPSIDTTHPGWTFGDPLPTAVTILFPKKRSLEYYTIKQWDATKGHHSSITSWTLEYTSDNGNTWILCDTNSAPSQDDYEGTYILDNPIYNVTGIRFTAISGSYDIHSVGQMRFYGKEYISAEEVWQDNVLNYGVCGKFVYDSVNNTVRLPKITGFIEGTTSLTALGDLIQAGLPNITGTFGGIPGKSGTLSEAFSTLNETIDSAWTGNEYKVPRKIYFDASGSNSIYGNSDTVQPQSIKVLYYIVIATSTKTDIEVDIDEIATDLNGKADVDLSNMNASQTVKETIISWGMPDWSATIKTTTGTNGFVAPNDGFVIFARGNSSTPASISINDSDIYPQKKLYLEGTLMVNKGDVVKDTSANDIPISFAPMKGVNNA